MKPDELAPLRADRLTLAYDGVPVVREVTLRLPRAQLTALVGPNACGKSTLLRGLARLLAPRGGSVYLDGRDIHRYPTREVARRLGLLPQAASTPEGLSVEDLVARGRYPYQSWLRQWSTDDERAVERALQLTGTTELRQRPVDELSGGQRQRAWIAMALAQETELLLLDEPTTFLDLAHQIEILDLLHALVADEGRTIVIVVHDLNHACRYADHLIAMRDGAIVAEGPPGDVVTGDLVRDVFDIECRIVRDPVTARPLVIPLTRLARAPGPAPSTLAPHDPPPAGELDAQP
ncbi:MAG TPA: ABC transporter ATP-binding protein [candidate division Zixibacteria bacterium]|nr:ABC transporter ATP-binding protein [candidate division Zixibacteria bacterium]